MINELIFGREIASRGGVIGVLIRAVKLTVPGFNLLKSMMLSSVASLAASPSYYAPLFSGAPSGPAVYLRHPAGLA